MPARQSIRFHTDLRALRWHAACESRPPCLLRSRLTSNDLHADLTGLGQGSVATYIPELAKADPDRFGICLVTMDGVAYGAGDTEPLFTIQSISKAFVYATALADRGRAFLETKVGVEPSGDAFNSISLDPQTGAPLNPMINAGAIATTSLVAGATVDQQWQRIASSIDAFAGRSARSGRSGLPVRKRQTGFATAPSHGCSRTSGSSTAIRWRRSRTISGNAPSLSNCRDLAFMAATLANDGVHPSTGNACDAAGRRRAGTERDGDLRHVRLRGKLAARRRHAGQERRRRRHHRRRCPGRFGIGIFSPKLDAKGNSVRGIAACERLSRDFGLHVFTRTGSPAMALGRVYTAAVAPSAVPAPA